jgi:hypothetical protein
LIAAFKDIDLILTRLMFLDAGMRCTWVSILCGWPARMHDGAEMDVRWKGEQPGADQTWVYYDIHFLTYLFSVGAQQ